MPERKHFFFVDPFPIVRSSQPRPIPRSTNSDKKACDGTHDKLSNNNNKEMLRRQVITTWSGLRKFGHIVLFCNLL